MDVSRVFLTITTVIIFYVERSTAGQSSVVANVITPKPALTLEVVSVPTELGEGPHWDETTQKLYFVDTFGQAVNRYDPKWKNTTTVYLDDTVSLVIPVHGEKNKFIISLGTKIALMTWDGESRKPSAVRILTNVGDPNDGSRIVDGKADPVGRLWAGTVGPKISITEYVLNRGVLFKLTEKLTADIQAVGITVSNGMAWSLDNKLMYYIDSYTRTVYAFDYDVRRGSIKNPRVIFDFVKYGIIGYPNGMTIDVEGKLWIASFEGAKVIRIDPSTGKLLRSISIPSSQVTSVTFGGPNLDELYVTSANTELTATELQKYPYPGYTFRIRGLGVKGFPDRRVILHS